MRLLVRFLDRAGPEASSSPSSPARPQVVAGRSTTNFLLPIDRWSSQHSQIRSCARECAQHLPGDSQLDPTATKFEKRNRPRTRRLRPVFDSRSALKILGPARVVRVRFPPRHQFLTESSQCSSCRSRLSRSAASSIRASQRKSRVRQVSLMIQANARVSAAGMIAPGCATRSACWSGLRAVWRAAAGGQPTSSHRRLSFDRNRQSIRPLRAATSEPNGVIGP